MGDSVTRYARDGMVVLTNWWRRGDGVAATPPPYPLSHIVSYTIPFSVFHFQFILYICTLFN